MGVMERYSFNAGFSIFILRQTFDCRSNFME